MKVALASALLGCALAVPAHADDCEHAAQRTANSAGPGIERVVVEAGAGDLVVRGGEGRDVKVDGKACASSKKLLEEIQLEIRRDGSTVYVRTLMPEMSVSLFGANAHMDVTVAVPKTATLKIQDSSGDMEVTDVQAAAIQDSSGDQTLERIAGDLEVQDSSGEIKIAGVRGGLRLRDSSGDVDVHDVQGDVVVETDSSGDIEIHNVKGDGTIDDDSSGGIVVQDVGGNFTVGSDGSGGIRYERVTGSVRIPD